jgi:hypothetical protein
VRQLGADEYYQNYFQELDVDKHLKIVEREVLATIYEFLTEHGVDTEEFISRQVRILNQSINNIVQIGSDNKVGSVASGAGASAVNSAGTDTRQPSGQSPQGG